MKKILIPAILLLLVLISCGSSEKDIYTKIKNEKKIVVGTEGTYAPFTYHDEKTGELTGFDVDIAREIAVRLEVEVEFLETAWDGLLTGVNTGRYDLVANQVWKKPAREEAYALSDNYMLTNAVIVSNRDSDIITLNDVSGRKAGHSLTSAYADISRDSGAEIVGVETFSLAIENLKNKRIDYTINDTATVAYHLAKYPDDNLQAYNLDADKFEVVLALPKENSESLLVEINKILSDMKADGKYNEIYSKYFEVIN